MSVAVVSLTYSLNDGTNYNDTYLQTGMVNATDFTCYSDYFNPLSYDIPETTTQSLAHVYREMATNSLCCPYNDLSDILSSKHDC